jgi:hypothetical protein
MVRVVVAEEDGIEGGEIRTLAGRERNALKAHDAKCVLEDGIEEGRCWLGESSQSPLPRQFDWAHSKYLSWARPHRQVCICMSDQ